MRPKSILPVMSKVYERLIFQQINAFIEENLIINSKISAYRKGQSTITVLQAIQDDVIKAIRRGEVTIMVLADFSKAFDTIQFSNLIIKMSKLGFSKQFLKWTLSFVTDRRQFFQIDDKISNMTAVKFGVPQGSVLGPVLFNIYVADLQSELSTKGYQYADDTTLYVHAKPKDLEFLQTTTGDTLSQLSDWSDRSSLALNSAKTKLMIISAREMSAKHSLGDFKPEIYVKGKKLDRTDTCKLLGVHLNDHLTWDNHIKIINGSCYGTLAILKKLKKMAPFNLRKQLAESLILSKIDYGDQVYAPLTVAQHKRLQKVQFAAASFVTGNYVRDSKTIFEVGMATHKGKKGTKPFENDS